MKSFDPKLPRPGDEFWQSLEAEPMFDGARGWLIGREVEHEKLGYGRIVHYEYDDSIILVEFQSSKGIEEFKYPDAFDYGPLRMVYSMIETRGFALISGEPDDNDMWKFFDDGETTMQGELFDSWMTPYNVEQILSPEDIKMLNFQRNYALGDEIPEEISLYDILPCTELPYINEFYLHVISRELELTPKSQAICLLKANVLCACQIIFGLPFWPQENPLEKFEDALQYLKEIMENDNPDATFEFLEFFPVVIQKRTQLPIQEAELVAKVLHEYIRFAAIKGYFGKEATARFMVE